jgi:hypothetical protein
MSSTNDQPVFLLETAFDIAAIIGANTAMVVAGGMAETSVRALASFEVLQVPQ